MSDYANVPGDGGLGRGGDLKQRFYDVAMIAKREERARIRREQAAVIAEIREWDEPEYSPWLEWADRLEETTRDKPGGPAEPRGAPAEPPVEPGGCRLGR